MTDQEQILYLLEKRKRIKEQFETVMEKYEHGGKVDAQEVARDLRAIYNNLYLLK